jgi:hypothetical protein
MPPTDVMFTRHVAGRMDDRQPNSVCRYRGLTVVSTRPTPLIHYIPSSRLDQHGAHDAALKAVRPRLRLRALRLDRNAADAPAPNRPEPPRKRPQPTPISNLTGPAPTWKTPTHASRPPTLAGWRWSASPVLPPGRLPHRRVTRLVRPTSGGTHRASVDGMPQVGEATAAAVACGCPKLCRRAVDLLNRCSPGTGMIRGGAPAWSTSGHANGAPAPRV